MTSQMKAIETHYKGYRMRSRLEARWAVFLDTLGIRWEYEKEGFELSNGQVYLPDFWLPQSNYWLEIKGQMLSGAETAKCEAFSIAVTEQNRTAGLVGGTFTSFYVLIGSPWFSWPGGEYKACRWHGTELSTWDELWTECPLCGEIDLRVPNWGMSGVETIGIYCEHCDLVDRHRPNVPYAWFHKGDVVCDDPGRVVFSGRLIEAYTAARQVRFEHGETPR